MQLYDYKETKEALERIRQKEPNINLSALFRDLLIDKANSLYGNEEKLILDKIKLAKEKIEDGQGELIMAENHYKQYMQKRLEIAESNNLKKQKEEVKKQVLTNLFNEQMNRTITEEEYKAYLEYYNNPPEGINPNMIHFCSLIKNEVRNDR